MTTKTESPLVELALHHALDVSATFPVDASPRPLVLTSDAVSAPAFGFPTVDAKEAFLTGLFVAPSTDRPDRDMRTGTPSSRRRRRWRSCAPREPQQGAHPGHRHRCASRASGSDSHRFRPTAAHACCLRGCSPTRASKTLPRSWLSYGLQSSGRHRNRSVRHPSVPGSVLTDAPPRSRSSERLSDKRHAPPTTRSTSLPPTPLSRSFCARPAVATPQGLASHVRSWAPHADKRLCFRHRSVTASSWTQDDKPRRDRSVTAYMSDAMKERGLRSW